MRLIIFLPAILFFIFAVIVANKLIVHSDSGSFSNVSIEGVEITEFSLPTLFNPKEKLSNKDLLGGYSIINIFASWCAPCRAEHPVLLGLAKKNLLPIYGINWKDDRDDVLNWLNSLGSPYNKVGIDKIGDVVTSFGITGAPETFLISADGKIIFRYPGAITEDIVNEEIIPRIKR